MNDDFGKSGRKFDQKLKPYLVFQYLMKYSDENHVVPASDLVAYLQEIGISAERRSIYRDIQEINRAIYISENDCTIDEANEALEDEDEKTVIYDKSKKGFFVRQRHYELDDIRMLAECVYAAKFIDERRAKRLVSVVCDLVSESQSEIIQHDALLIDRLRTENVKTYYNIAIINAAMSTTIEGRKHTPEKISFKYLKYTIQDLKKQVERRGGAKYIVSPFKLLINDGNYYLLAYSDSEKELRTYRIDRMKDVQAIGERREGEEVFAALDLSTYTQRVFSMFNGEKEYVTIDFVNSLLDTAIERFGTKDAVYRKTDAEHFSVIVQVEISNPFYGWICGFGNRAKITEPKWVADDFKAYLNKMMNLYDKS